MIGFDFVLLAILGLVAFAPPASGRGKLVLMILFVVLMILWLVVGATGYNLHNLFSK